MARAVDWKFPLAIGIVLTVQTLFDFTPPGPWNSRSFTRGVLGLTGLCLIYVAWFRFTFNKKGIIPSISLWKNPNKSWKSVFLFSIICLAAVFTINNTNLSDKLPETSGMILMLIACLGLLNSLYVWLVTSGILLEEE